MNITNRRYKMLTDFVRVHRFLQETYDPVTLNSYLLPQYFEYAHTHPRFNSKLTHRFGLWEDNGSVVGIVCYEMDLGENHLHVGKGYETLIADLLKWAERELWAQKDGKREISVWITDKEPQKRQLLIDNNYCLDSSYPVKIFEYKNSFSKRSLPDGFSLIDGSNVDYKKLHACFWKGFDHGDTPDGDVDGNIQMCNSPNADMSLMTIAVAPNGDYACALGMWFDKLNKYAYLEPLATVPEYRRMGLATVTLTEAMKKTKALGAEYCFGGGREFYSAIGFREICNRELWKKELETPGV